MSEYYIIKNALIANGYAIESARRIANRLRKRKNPIAAFNLEYSNF